MFSTICTFRNLEHGESGFSITSLNIPCLTWSWYTWPELSQERKGRICMVQQEKRQGTHAGYFLCPEHKDFENTESSSGNSCLELLMKWCSPSSPGLWWDVNILSQWQLVHRHSIPSQMEAALAAEAHGELKSSPSPGTALPPQMKKEMFVMWRFPAPLLWGIPTSGNTRNHKPNTE